MPADALFGREEALADLRRVLRRSDEGRGALVLVRGEAGIGKTSLVEAATEGRTALWGRAVASEVAPALHVWAQLLRAAERRGLLADAEAPLAPVASGPGSGQERFLRVDGIIRAVRSLALAGPVVLVLDDVQWADPESLLVVELLAAELVDLPLALVLTAREGDLAGLPRPDLTVALTGLDAAGVAALIVAGRGDGPAPDPDGLERRVASLDPAVVAVALERTAGNPFFVIEVVRLLRDRATDAAAWRGAVPEGARAVLRRRVAALSAGAQGALLLAAVSTDGLGVDVGLVADAAAVPAAELDRDLAEAAAAGLVRDGGDGRVAFAHALVRDALLGDAPAVQVRRLHAALARAAADRPDPVAAVVAAHHGAAGERAAAARWAERAADAAAAAAAYDEAAGWLARALAEGDQDDPVSALDRRLRLAELLSRAGRVDEARGHFLEVAAVERGRDDERFGRAALGVGALGGGFEIQLLDQSQVTLLAEALDRLGEEPPALVARLRARLSVALTLQEDHARRLELAEGAVDLARRAGDDHALVHALAAWCDANADPGHVDERLERAAAMVTAAVRTGDPELELLARRFRIVALMERGRVPEAAAEIEAFAGLADALRQPSFRWYARLAEGMLAFLRGDLDGAETLARVAAAEGRRAASRNARMLGAALLGAVRRERGDLEGFLAILKEGNQAGSEAERGAEAGYRLFLVGYGVDRALVGEVLAAFPEDLSWTDHDGLYLQVWSVLGDAAAFAGDARWAAVAEARLAPFPDLFILDGTAAVCFGPVAATLARLAAARGDREAARGLFASALALLPVGAPLLRARIERDRDELVGAVAAGPTGVTPIATGRLVREGATWALAYGAERAHLRDSKGLRDLAVLVARPDQEVHCLDLVAAAEGHGGDGRPAADGDLGPALDATARGQYEARIRDLTVSIDEAEAAGRDGEAARLDEERAFLLRELAGALGLSGRDRPQGRDTERARKAVTMRLRDAVGRIEAEAPALGRHLRHAVRTGTWCAYAPEQPVEWEVAP